jgi:hypothetical protein
MKYATRMLALALTMLPLLATAQLASNEKIVAQVPFEFVLGSKVVPAGEWIVQSASMDSKVIQIRSSDSRVNILSMPLLVETKKAAADCTLVFHKYGSNYFLSEVRLAGTANGYRLPETKAEKEMRAQNIPATSEILLASRE